MIKILTNKNDSGKRIDNFIFKCLDNCPKTLIYKAFRNKDVKVNGKRINNISYLIQEGDIIEIYLPTNITLKKQTKNSYPFIKASKKINIVFEDENILIVNKPAGLICHSDKKTFGDTLIDRILRYLYEKNEYSPDDENSFAPALCNRIDRNTCGLVISAKNANALHQINEIIQNKELSKYYYCLVHGKMPKTSDCLESYISRDTNKNITTVYNNSSETSTKIITQYKVVEEYHNNTSLVEIKLITGKTHQIRAHLYHINNPILGDPKYNNKVDKNYKYQALGAYKIIFNGLKGDLQYLNGKEIITKDLWFINDSNIK